MKRIAVLLLCLMLLAALCSCVKTSDTNTLQGIDQMELTTDVPAGETSPVLTAAPDEIVPASDFNG